MSPQKIGMLTKDEFIQEIRNTSILINSIDINCGQWPITTKRPINKHKNPTMQLIKESRPDLSRWSVSRFGMMEYNETPTDRIGRTFVGLVIFPFALIVGLIVVASLIAGSFYQWLKGR